MPMTGVATDLNRDVAVVPLRFWRDHEPTDDKGNYREVEWVEYAKKGTDGATVIDKVKRLQKSQSQVWPALERFYEAWKRGQQEPISGTPLDAWPAVTKGQVEQLRLLHLLSVDDLAQSSDSTLDKIGMGARALRDKARAFVKAKEGLAGVAEALAAKDEKIAALEAQVADLAAAVKELGAGLPRRKMPAAINEGADAGP